MFRPPKPKEEQKKTSSSNAEHKQEVAPLPQAVLPLAIRRYGTGIQVTTPPITDHGALSGLGDNDHPQYELAGISLLLDGSRAMTGDLVFPHLCLVSDPTNDGTLDIMSLTKEAYRSLRCYDLTVYASLIASSFEAARAVFSDDNLWGTAESLHLGADSEVLMTLWRYAVDNQWIEIYNDVFLQLAKITNSLPSASDIHRGKLIRVEGGTGEKDILYLCKKKADETYAWLKLLDELDVPTLTLDNLEDVEITSPADNEVLTYESATSLWKNKAPSGVGLILFGFYYATSSFTVSPLYYGLNGTGTTVSENYVKTAIVAGTFKKLKINISANTRTVAVVFTLRVNSQNTALTLTVNAGQTGIFETQTDVVAAENDLVNMMISSGAGNGIVYWSQSIVFEPS